MDRADQEAHIDVLFAQWKEQMLRMPETIPVFMLYATMQPASGAWGIFVNAPFQQIYQFLMEAMVRGDLPIETDLFPPDDLCTFKLMDYPPGQYMVGVPHLCSHTREQHGGDDVGACQVADCECLAWLPAPVLTAADFEGEEKKMIIPVVAGCYINDGKVLLQARTFERRNKEFLNFPGGKVEPGETLEQALLRELREELGVTVVGSRLVHSQINQYEGQEDSYLVLFYELMLSETQIRDVDSSGNALVWIPLDEVEEQNTLPGTLETIAAIAAAPEDDEVCFECGGRGTIHENSAIACPICTPLGGGHGSNS